MIYQIYPIVKEVYENENKYYNLEVKRLKAEVKIKIKNIDKVIKEVKKDKVLSEKYLETLINLRNDLTF